MTETTTQDQAIGPMDEAEAQVAMAETITLAQEDALDAVEHAGAAVFEGFSTAQKEIADFLSERIRQDMETQGELLRCRTFDDIRAAQTRFFRTAMDQYAAEATKLMKIGAGMIVPVQPH